MLSLMFFVVLILGINGQSKEEIIRFNWPGPLEVPVSNQPAIQPPDRVSFAFASSSINRILRIREGVFTSFDCSVLLNQLSNMFVVDAMTSWSVNRFDASNMPLGEPQPIDDYSKIYNTFETSNQFLNITNPALPMLAAEGESGVYTCEACGSMVAIGSNPVRVCINSSTTLLIEADPPVIITTPGTNIDQMFFGFNIGNDYCIRSPPVGDTVIGLDILCLHNETFNIPRDPPPVATWTRNGVPITGAISRMFELGADFSGGVGRNGRLTILPPLIPAAPYVGLFMCNLTSIHGQDSATSRIFNSDLRASATIPGQAHGGCSRCNITNKANTLCAAIGEEVTITCSAPGGSTLSGPGGLSSQESTLTLSSVSSSDGGVYTCRSGPPCNDEMSFTIITFDLEPGCTGDNFPDICPFIAAQTSLCQDDVIKEICCWSCR